MTIRSDLEGRIANALARLSDPDMQRVAEDYARIRYPERFPRFDFRAFSQEGKSRPGWPDAWISSGEYIDGVEATCAKSKKAVQGHLDDYLTKARSCQPKLRGFIHVSGHPAIQLDQEEVLDWRQRFINEAGIDPDRLELVFGGGLVEALACPEFGRTRAELLSLPDSPRYFKLVRAKRSPDESRLNSAFVPTDEDYAAGRVFRSEAADKVLSRLYRDGCALVRGVGASGKSVLAWLLALEFAERRCPAYLLDVADFAEISPEVGSGLIEDVHRFGHPQVLFVVDNCHLAESLTKEVFLAWQELVPSQQPRLLLLGRELQTSRGSLIDGLGIEPLPLKAQQSELLGVYRRLAWRHTRDTPPPEPAPDVLDEWVGNFGGDPYSPDTTTDLIAFSAAVARRLPDLLQKRWKLDPRDAVDEIRSVYLRPEKLSAGEVQNLMRLCVLEELELALPAEALVDRRAGLDRCNLHHGIVFRQRAGRARQYIRYRLAHAALGKLILRAAYDQVNEVAERRSVALQHPFTGAGILARLAATGRLQEASELVLEILNHPSFLLDLTSLQFTHLTLRHIQAVGIPLPPRLGEMLIVPHNRSRLMERALQTPLDHLANFLGYTAKTAQLEPIFKTFAEDLARPEHRKPLLERALQTPLGDLTIFLDYAAKTAQLEPIFKTLAEDLTRPENRKSLLERALQTPLSDLARFLSYAAKTAQLNAIFQILAEDLVWPENRNSLLKRALQTPLHFLANFLGYVAKTAQLKLIFKSLAEDLARPENLKPLIEGALQTPLSYLANFLDYAANNVQLEPIFTAFVEELAQPGNRPKLVIAMTRLPLDSLVSILTSEMLADLWDSIFTEVEIICFNKARRKGEKLKLDAFVSFQRISRQRGRPEFAEAIAMRLISESTRDDWHQPVIGLHHLSHVLRNAREASPAEIERFLGSIATPEFVDRCIHAAPPGGLAGCLLALANTLEPDRRRWFLRESLARRVEHEVSLKQMYNAESRADAFALLGAAAAIGLTNLVKRVDWLTSRDLVEVQELRAPAPDRTTIGPLQVQLWLGLREIARVAPDSFLVSPPLADRILDLWLATQESEIADKLPLHVRELNSSMIAWLQQCKGAGWRLVPPPN